MTSEKPCLPFGWVVKQSKSYPDRVYYFNINTGVTTWEIPQLIDTELPSKAVKSHGHDGDETVVGEEFSSQDSETNEPVFSQFQSAIYDDVIKNSPSNTDSNELIKSPVIPKIEQDSDQKQSSQRKTSSRNRKVSDSDLKKEHEFVEASVAKKVKSQDEGSKKEKKRPDTSAREKHHSSGDSLTSSLRSVDTKGTKRVVKQELRTSPRLKRSCISTAEKNESAGKRKAHVSGEFNSPTARKKRKRLLDTSSEGSVASELLSEKGRYSKLVQLKQDRNSQSSGDSVQKASKELKREPGVKDVKVKKSSLETDLSLTVSVGEKRQVWISREISPKIRKKSDDELNLNVKSEPFESKICDSQNVLAESCQVKENKPQTDVNTVKSPSLPADQMVKPEGSKKVKQKHTDSDIRLVVSSDSEANNNNNGLGDGVRMKSQLKSDRLQQIQAWVDNISSYSESPPKTSAKEKPEQHTVTSSGLVDRSRDEEADCQMDVDTDDEDEDMIIEMQDVREELNIFPSQPVQELSVPEKSPEHLQVHPKCLCLIIDTNVLINYLKMLTDVRDENIEGFGLPYFVFPWVVIQELDVLKNRNSSSSEFSQSKGVQKKATNAIKYVNTCFTSRHPRVSGQSPLEACQEIEGLKLECNDDRVLQCCLQHKRSYPSSSVILLTEDVNLQSKALVSGVESCSIKQLPASAADVYRKMPLDNKVDAGRASPKFPKSFDTPCASDNAPPRTTSSPVPSRIPLDTDQLQTDKLLVAIKSEIKLALGAVLEIEMKQAFGELWLSVVYRKPPWSAVDVMQSFKKHWMAVFGMIIPRYLSKNVESILRLISGKTGNVKKEEVIAVFSDIIILMRELQRHCSYEGRLGKSINNLNNLLKHLRSEKERNTPQHQETQKVVSYPVGVESSTYPSPSSLHSHFYKPSPSSSDKAHPMPRRLTSPSSKLSSNQKDRPKNLSASQFASPRSLSIATNELIDLQKKYSIMPTKSKPSEINKNTSQSVPNLSNPLFKKDVKRRSSVVSSQPQSDAVPEQHKLVQSDLFVDQQTLVHSCFQTVWENIHSICAETEAALIQSMSDKYINLLTRLTEAVSQLRHDYVICLNIPLNQLPHSLPHFGRLSERLNNFFVKLKHKPVYFQPVNEKAMFAFFSSTDKRSILEAGKQQLDDIIKNLYIIVQKLPNSP